MTSLPISSLYVPIFGIFLVIITLRVGVTRIRSNISLGDGGNPEFLKLIRGQANFVELVPISLLLLVLLELSGTSQTVMHVFYLLLLLGRLSHYVQITGIVEPVPFRAGGMMLTFASILGASIMLLL